MSNQSVTCKCLVIIIGFYSLGFVMYLIMAEMHFAALCFALGCLFVCLLQWYIQKGIEEKSPINQPKVEKSYCDLFSRLDAQGIEQYIKRVDCEGNFKQTPCITTVDIERRCCHNGDGNCRPTFEYRAKNIYGDFPMRDERLNIYSQENDRRIHRSLDRQHYNDRNMCFDEHYYDTHDRRVSYDNQKYRKNTVVRTSPKRHEPNTSQESLQNTEGSSQMLSSTNSSQINQASKTKPKGENKLSHSKESYSSSVGEPKKKKARCSIKMHKKEKTKGEKTKKEKNKKEKNKKEKNNKGKTNKKNDKKLDGRNKSLPRSGSKLSRK